ncbi:MAG: DUF3373 domain-containing protein [Desulfobulbaceae bacterium]|nr:DUF3373 domain-containing protein [Desulfobulbaceae bacterium]
MRKTLTTAAVLLAIANAAGAAELIVKVPVDEYQQTKAQLQEMQKKINALETKLDKIQTPAQSQPQPQPQAKAGDEPYSPERLKKMDRDISEIYDTLDKVETRAIKDRINLGAEVRVRMDNYRVKNYQPMYYGYNVAQGGYSWFGPAGMVAPGNEVPFVADERNDANYSSRFRINMEADVYKSIKFSARLALQKNWADSVGAFSHDNNRSHTASGDTNLKVDRFYIDWTPKFVVPLSISFGRLPTSDGPPQEFKENRKRQSIYPSIIFDGEPDGIVATVGLERYLGLKNAGLRYFYAMAVQYDADQTSMWYLDSVANDMYKDNRVQALFFESELPGLRDSLMVLSYVPAVDLLMQSPDGKSAANVGDVTLYGVHLQLSDIFGSGLDLFGSYGENHNKPSGNTVSMGGMPMGLMSSGADVATVGKTTGRGWYVGVRYEVPVDALNRPKIGFEYNQGSQYWFSYTPGPSEVYNKLATRGMAYDFYYLQPFNEYLFLRTGYTKIVYDYAGSGMPIGTPMEYETLPWQHGEKPEFHNFYITLDSRF